MTTKKTKPAKKPAPKTSSKTAAKTGGASKKGGTGGKAAAPKKTGTTQSVHRRALIDELTSMAGTMGDAELAGLVQHARIMAHNTKVVQQFEEGKKLRADVMGTMGPDAASIEEGGGGNHFIIILHRHRCFFARDEMKNVVRLCHAAQGRADAQVRLYTWFSRERGDVVRNGRLTGSGDEQLGQLYDLIVSTYTTAG